ncbi:MAG: hypothetical protein GWN58_31805 [Anaerolineae bacterium]|nr:hypothetical protein [Anaerolineae bacterium]
MPWVIETEDGTAVVVEAKPACESIKFDTRDQAEAYAAEVNMTTEEYLALLEQTTVNLED